VRCLTVAETLQWILVRKCPSNQRKVGKNVSSVSDPDQAFDGLSYFGAYFSANVAIAVSPSPIRRQPISRSLCALALNGFRKLCRNVNVVQPSSVYASKGGLVEAFQKPAPHRRRHSGAIDKPRAFKSTSNSSLCASPACPSGKPINSFLPSGRRANRPACIRLGQSPADNASPTRKLARAKIAVFAPLILVSTRLDGRHCARGLRFLRASRENLKIARRIRAE